MEYIRTHEVEKLFELWPTLIALYEHVAGETANDMERDDYIYSLAIGSKPMDNMPPTGKISDPTCNIATTYAKQMQQDKRIVAKSINYDALKISFALDRLEYAFHRLSLLQRKILPLCYWDKLTWREISIKASKSGRYIAPNAAKELKKSGTERMARELQMPSHIYAELMDILLEFAK